MSKTSFETSIADDEYHYFGTVSYMQLTPLVSTNLTNIRFCNIFRFIPDFLQSSSIHFLPLFRLSLTTAHLISIVFFLLPFFLASFSFLCPPHLFLPTLSFVVLPPLSRPPFLLPPIRPSFLPPLPLSLSSASLRRLHFSFSFLIPLSFVLPTLPSKYWKYAPIITSAIYTSSLICYRKTKSSSISLLCFETKIRNFLCRAIHIFFCSLSTQVHFLFGIISSHFDWRLKMLNRNTKNSQIYKIHKKNVDSIAKNKSFPFYLHNH